HNYGRELLRLFTVTMDRDMTAFWEDNWIGGNVLKDLYPRIYALETFKSVIVRKKLTDSSFDNSFHRKTRGGVEQVGVVFGELEGVLCGSVRKVIDEKRLSNVTTMTRWIKCVPIKVNVLAWKIKIAALPTRLNISRRGIFMLCGGTYGRIETSSFLRLNLH
nr:hypothetical protein [Tanacetum cinerariifolium]